jgi:hypothetical protein
MELLAICLVVAALELAAIRWGVDSRDGFRTRRGDPHD